MIDKETYGIYFLCKDNNVVYVGQSINVYRRVPEHTDKEFDEWFFIKADRDELDRLETMFIKQLAPMYNVANKPKQKEHIPQVKHREEEKPMYRNVRFASIRDSSRITGLSMFYLRTGIKANTIPHIRSGNKYLVNIPALMTRLNTEGGT